MPNNVSDTTGTDLTARAIPSTLPSMAVSKPQGYDDILFDTIKNILMLGGGGVGAASGLLDAGTTSIPGAIVGAGLGRGMGEGIHNLYKQQSGKSIDTYAPFKAIPEGATMEMGGQAGGALLGKLAQLIKPTEITTLPGVLTTDSNNILRKEYHGSSEPIMSPVAGRVNTGTKGSEGFYTTPSRDIAENMGGVSFFKQGLANMDGGAIPKPIITPYYMSRVNEMNIVPPVSFKTANELGETLGMTKPEIDKAIITSLNTHGSIDGEHLWETFSRMKEMRGNDYRETGAVMTDAMKKAGYRRLKVNMDPGSKPAETFHYYPEEDLYPLGSPKLKELQERLAAGSKEEISPLTQKMIDLLSKTAISGGEKK